MHAMNAAASTHLLQDVRSLPCASTVAATSLDADADGRRWSIQNE
ncbi:hypothetical protein PF005_g33210 [Phytophthora fragariae]|uniref:Uncharacterized protein n=1 Tax=Phytophthora fragariae TaxID=53985 RepID=A0A6A3UYK6_9STRA|nr:hypothetical protein PF005_g33210 [Phytophthora fragariae]